MFRQTVGGTEYDIAIVKLSANAPEDYRPIPLVSRSIGIGADTIQVFGFGTDREDVIPAFAKQMFLAAVDNNFWLAMISAV